ncbi:MAG: hypothetical protein KGI69_00980 [Patescibacteria group bacterium]|nr:hypothetical protein [Patescibacteria group bacterium]
MGKLSQSGVGFWYGKLKSQLELLKEKKDKEPLERAFALDIALSYLFLYLFIESTIDQLAMNLFPQVLRLNSYDKYKSQRRNIYQKVEYLFGSFCSILPFQRYSDLRDKIKPITNMRNNVVHLEEMVWYVNDLFDKEGKMNSHHKEIPNKYTKDLTITALRNHYESAWEFLEVFRVTLNDGLGNRSIEVNYDGEKRTINLVDYMYEISVVPPKNRVEF